MEPTQRLVRSDIDRIVGGVCGGIANYLDVDPFIVRVLFVVLSWAFGFSWVLYAVLWATIPSANATHPSDMMTGQVQPAAQSENATI